jgi:hypothetical protein
MPVLFVCHQDIANVDQGQQNKILDEARQALKTWESKLVWLRMFTTQAVAHVKEPLDFVYVDARHDYCGVLEDIQTWWPLLRPGEPHINTIKHGTSCDTSYMFNV